jgi:hypothetical protein
MIQQSNALRRLEQILTEAVNSGNKNQKAGVVLLQAMQADVEPYRLVDLYEILNKAEEETKSIKKNNINRYLQTITDLHQLFIVNHLWDTQWENLATSIQNKGVLNTLDSLAEFFSQQNPAIFLEQDFLGKLNDEFESVLKEILSSDLANELKRFLTQRLEDILRAIRRYNIDGTEGLEKAAKSLINDLVMGENSLKKEDRTNPIYKKVTSCVLGFLLYIAPTPYDIIGAVPDLQDFWVPKFEELVAGQKKLEQGISETSTMLEAFEKASEIFHRREQKMIMGREMKALPASKEDP